MLFTEHRDTLAYLQRRISSLLGRPQAVALIHGGMGREEMERAEARRLQPHYIESFFLEAFSRLGGTARQREPRRYQITHVPAPVRNRDRAIGMGDPVLERYERVAFEKDLLTPPGQPMAAFVCPGHPLLDAVLDLTLERHRDLLRRGTVLVDERDAGTSPRADDLQGRLQKRLAELDAEAQLSTLPPAVLGGLVVVPRGLLEMMAGRPSLRAATPADPQASGARARAVVMEIERALGFEPVDRELEKLGYDIESRDPVRGHLRFIEVKGRVTGADTVTVTKNEILYSLNKPDDFILALVEFLPGDSHRVHYLREPFHREPDFGVTSVNYDFEDLLARAEAPC